MWVAVEVVVVKGLVVVGLSLFCSVLVLLGWVVLGSGCGCGRGCACCRVLLWLLI